MPASEWMVRVLVGVSDFEEVWAVRGWLPLLPGLRLRSSPPMPAPRPPAPSNPPNPTGEAEGADGDEFVDTRTRAPPSLSPSCPPNPPLAHNRNTLPFSLFPPLPSQEKLKELTEKCSAELEVDRQKFELLLGEKNEQEMEYEDKLKQVGLVCCSGW